MKISLTYCDFKISNQQQKFIVTFVHYNPNDFRVCHTFRFKRINNFFETSDKTLKFQRIFQYHLQLFFHIIQVNYFPVKKGAFLMPTKWIQIIIISVATTVCIFIFLQNLSYKMSMCHPILYFYRNDAFHFFKY